MNVALKASWLGACLIGLAACSGGNAGNGAEAHESQGGNTVEAGPLLCLLQNDGSGSQLASVTCGVTIGNSQASTEGIDVSVTNILHAIVLPDVCPNFDKAEVFADSRGFSSEVQSELSAAYLRSGIGWTVGSASCQFSEYAAP